MNGAVIKTEFLRDCLKDIPPIYSKDLIYEDAQLFAFANFTSVSDFTYVYNAFRKDKYKLKALFHSDMKSFILDCARSLAQKNDYKRLIFMYALLAVDTFEEHLIPHINCLKDEKSSLDEVYNSLDYSYAHLKLNHDLTKESLYSLYPEGFYYYDYVEDLIHYPLVKNYKFMGSRGYFKKAYSRFQFYAKYNSRGKWHKPFFFLWDKLFARHKTGKEYFLYKVSLNETVLNSIHKEYRMGSEVLTYSFDDIWSMSKKEALRKIDALNKMLFLHDKKEFEKMFETQKENTESSE